MSEKYLAMSPGPYGGSGYYGKGASVDEAKANLKKHGGELTQHLVMLMPDGAHDVFVDDTGQVRWSWAEGADRSAQPEVVAKRGVTLV